MSMENDHGNASLAQLKCMALTDALMTLIRESGDHQVRRQASELCQDVAKVAKGITAISNQIVE
ncbi:hypothetical protein ES703_124276 [subsurface metagenome]